MWDARLEAIRDRKLNELVIFVAFVRTDMSKRSEYIDIINRINKDLDLVEALAENNPIPETTPIEYESYRSRLSKLESMDEYCLDACRKGENDFGPIICKEHMTTSVAVKPKSDIAVQPKAESPAVIPEYPKPMQMEEPQVPANVKIPEKPANVIIPEKPAPITSDAVVADTPEEVSKPAAAEEPADQVSEDTPAEDAIPAPAEQPAGEEAADGVVDFIISIEDAVSLKNVRSMKDGKIDLFIDRELNGHFNDEACENVITFLKTDLKLIDLILSINVTSKEDIESKIRAIVDFVASSDEPQNQRMYINSLNEEERDLEGEYNAVLKRLEDVIAERYGSVLSEDQKSIFFR